MPAVVMWMAIELTILLTLTAALGPAAEAAAYRPDLGWLSKAAPPLPPPEGAVVRVSTVSELQAAVRTAGPGTTILITDGTYRLTETLVLDRDGLALRGESGQREKVVLLGNGFHGERAGPPHAIRIIGDHITVADLTIREFSLHGLDVKGELGPQHLLVHHVGFIDIGQRSIKVSSAGAGHPNADHGVVEWSYFEQMQSISPDRDDGFGGNYVGGIDAHGVKGWVIRDNIFVNIRGATGAGRACIFIWNNSIDTVVERNLVIGCDVGISIGNPSGPNQFARDGEKVWHHTGGIVRNNFIVAPAGKIGAEMDKVRGLMFVHNTVVNGDPGYWRTVWFQQPTQALVIKNNLVGGLITPFEGAQAEMAHNITRAPREWFRDPENGDLRLTEAAAAALGAAQELEGVDDDFFGRPRTGAREIGAHQRSE
ncbi:MAG TPA: hypothetical protein VF234_05790 [Limnochordia bacterium]